MQIKTTQRDDVLEITIDNPPVNALGHAVRQGLLDALLAGSRDPATRVIVIAGAGRTFCAGADITEFGKPPREPILRNLCDAIELLDKPVVAALHGTVLGGGLEIALACHYRVAAPSARLGLPEVKLGLLPGAGGTQRLPRLVGVAPALEMIVTGDPVSVDKALDLGLIELVVPEEDLRGEACRFASAVADERPLRRTAELRPVGDAATINDYAKANARKLKGRDAPAACFEALNATLTQPFAEGIETEKRLFRQLVEGAQSAALRYAFFAERKAAKVEGLGPEVGPLEIASVGIVGSGTMGSGIAMAFLSSGFPVTLYESSPDALKRGTAMIQRSYESSVAKGRIDQRECDECLARLKPTHDLSTLGNCDLIIEAVFELMQVKRDVFAQIDAAAKAGAILATNTSYLDIDEIASATRRPESVVGLHFFSPANIMKLLEVVRGSQTAPEIMATAMALAKRIGKIAVVSGNAHGFIGNRILARRRNEALDLLLDGATVQQVDEAHTGFGMPMGPFQMSDLAGLDIGWHRDPSRIESIRDALCAAGRLGQKTGKGYYDYDEQRRATPSAEAQEIIASFADKAGRVPRKISNEEILERTLYAMVDEGARLLAEGVAQRASDIDVVWVNGYGWPAYRGGPMYWGAQVGLGHIVERLKVHGRPAAPLLARTAADGGAFS